MTILAGIAVAQDKELWPKWDKGKVQKMLNSSAWGQTQTDTDTSADDLHSDQRGRNVIQSDRPPPALPDRYSNHRSAVQGSRADQGATNQAMNVNYYVRFLSAKPIRQAFARMIEIQEKDAKSVREQLGPFVERDFSDFIVVTVDVRLLRTVVSLAQCCRLLQAQLRGRSRTRPISNAAMANDFLWSTTNRRSTMVLGQSISFLARLTANRS